MGDKRIKPTHGVHLEKHVDLWEQKKIPALAREHINESFALPALLLDSCLQNALAVAVLLSLPLAQCTVFPFDEVGARIEGNSPKRGRFRPCSFGRSLAGTGKPSRCLAAGGVRNGRTSFSPAQAAAAAAAASAAPVTTLTATTTTTTAAATAHSLFTITDSRLVE